MEEEVKNKSLEEKMNQEKAEKKEKDKKNTFTLIYILVGIFLIAILGMLLFAFLMSK